jgi:hypothetical protein
MRARWYTTTGLRQAWIIGLTFASVGFVLLGLALTTGPGWLVGGAGPSLGISLPWIATAIGLSRRRRAGHRCER